MRKKLLSFYSLILLSMLILSFTFKIAKANPDYEDLENDYTTVGANTTFISAYEAKADPYDRDVDEYVYSDEGAGYFVDFEHYFDMFWDGTSHDTAGVMYFWILSNDLDDGFNLLNGIGIRGEEFNTKVKYYLFEVGGASDSTAWITYHVWYYCIVERSGTTLTLKIYSTDCLRIARGAADVDTLTIEVALTTYRYIYAISSHNTGHAARDTYGNIRNLDLQRSGTEFITFYHNSGGILKVDGVTIANGTEIAYVNETVIELVGVVEGNLTYGFNNFTWNGNYNISNPYNLTVTSNLTLWCYFEVPPAGAATPYIIAAFNWTATNPNANVTVVFNGTYSDSSSAITNYSWNFADGNTTSGNYPTIIHQFAANGTYGVKLTVTSLVGTSNIIEGITIGGGTAASTSYNWLPIAFIIGCFAFVITAYALTGKN